MGLSSLVVRRTLSECVSKIQRGHASVACSRALTGLSHWSGGESNVIAGFAPTQQTHTGFVFIASRVLDSVR